ncbi:MAG: glycosyltransferase [Paludibacter sp.]|nr:glycosyltransferase [Paludibacter sp.]
MNLYLFPAPANLEGGYNFGVHFAYNKLKPQSEDIVVWCANTSNIPYIKSNDVFVKLPQLYSFESLKKILQNRFHHEIDYDTLKSLNKLEFDSIHCDEVTFYRAIRKLYPNKQINLRFHNCFARIKERERILGVKQDWRFEKKMDTLAKLEFEIFNDKNVFKIFISDEDRNYYTSMTGSISDSEVWYYEPEIPTKQDILNILDKKLVWYGGVEGHKTSSVMWFIKYVLPKVKQVIPDIEFHLWGSQTSQFNNPENNIFGHGRYNGDDLPLKGKALYVNPDVIGGGIKIKLMTYFKEGVPFISTPFGFEGYKNDLIDNSYCHVVEMDDWANKIVEILG